MAKLKKCGSCNHEISKKAKTCPSCGEPQKKKTSFLKLFILSTIIFTSYYITTSQDYSRSNTTTRVAKKPLSKAELAKKKADALKLKKRYQKECNIIYNTYVKTINAGASKMVISKGASELYDKIRDVTDECKYIRYSFRTLRKPYEGNKVSPKEWDTAIRNLINKSEY